MSFKVVLIMKQKFNIVLQLKYFLYLQIIITLCEVKFEYFEYNFRLKYFLSLWSLGQVMSGFKENESKVFYKNQRIHQSLSLIEPSKRGLSLTLIWRGVWSLFLGGQVLCLSFCI